VTSAGDSQAGSLQARAITPDAICEAYAARVFKFAQLVSRDSANAEDLAQDALERAVRGLATFDPARGSVEAWLWRIVVNAARDSGRIARRERLVFESLVERWTPEGESPGVADIRLEPVMSAVRSLSSRHRAVIALRYGADLTHRDVGKALGISEAAALMSIKRALAILRRRLSEGVDRDV